LKLALAVLLVGCSQGTYVLVDVSQCGDTPIFQIEAQVTLGSDTASVEVPKNISTPIDLPTSFVLKLPDGAQGDVSLTLFGKDENGVALSSGSVTQMLVTSDSVEVAVALSGASCVQPPPPDLLPPSDLVGVIPQLFFLQISAASGMYAVQPMTIGIDGSNLRPVGCAVNYAVAPPAQRRFPDTLNGILLLGMNGARYAPGAQPLFAYNEIFDADGGSYRSNLRVTQASDSCSSTPPLADAQMYLHGSPRFSPSGTRLAYLDGNSNGVVELVTVNINGTNRLARAGNLLPTPPVWLDETHIAWAEAVPTGTSSMAMVRFAEDKMGSSALQVFPCPGYERYGIDQVEFLGGGQFIIALRTGAGVEIRAADAASGCAGAILTPQRKGDASRDFALAPSKKMLVFSTTMGSPTEPTDGLAGPFSLYAVNTDGSGLRSFFQDSSYDNLAPQWIDADHLAWMQLPHSGGSPRIMVVNGDGSNAHPLVAGAAPVTHVLLGTNAGMVCSFTTAGSAVPAALFAIVVAIRSWRRRRR
jgi:hypothetical protein